MSSILANQRLRHQFKVVDAQAISVNTPLPQHFLVNPLALSSDT